MNDSGGTDLFPWGYVSLRAWVDTTGMYLRYGLMIQNTEFQRFIWVPGMLCWKQTRTQSTMPQRNNDNNKCSNANQDYHGSLVKPLARLNTQQFADILAVAFVRANQNAAANIPLPSNSIQSQVNMTVMSMVNVCR